MPDLPGLFEPTPGERAAAKEISRLRTDIAKAERERIALQDNAYLILIRAERAEAALAAAREVIEPLLDHYLKCYEGNADRLVYNARAFLKRTMPRPGSPE